MKSPTLFALPEAHMQLRRPSAIHVQQQII